MPDSAFPTGVADTSVGHGMLDDPAAVPPVARQGKADRLPRRVVADDLPRYPGQMETAAHERRRANV